MMRIWSLLLCCLLLFAGCSGSGAREEAPETGEFSAEIVQLVPEGERTHEEIVAGAQDLCTSAQDSLKRMGEEAQARGGDAEAIAEAARTEWEPRLTELAELDYAAMEDAQIYAAMEEVSNILTAFREARDAIEALD